LKGHTTQNSSGAGIALVLYNLSNDKELWRGRIYVPGDRSGFEAEYSAIIIGLDFAKEHGVQKLIVHSSNDAIVNQSKFHTKSLLVTHFCVIFTNFRFLTASKRNLQGQQIFTETLAQNPKKI
jgi:ribonuclease HI